MWTLTPMQVPYLHTDPEAPVPALDQRGWGRAVFDLVAGTCGILAFVVLCVQGALLLRNEKQRFFTADPTRALAMAKGACDRKHLTYSELSGTVAGLEVSGRAYKVRSVRHQGERAGWLGQGMASPREQR